MYPPRLIPKRAGAGLDAGQIIGSVGSLIVAIEGEYGCSVPFPILGVAVGKGPGSALAVAAAGQIPPSVLPRTGRVNGKVAVIHAEFVLIHKDNHVIRPGVGWDHLAVFTHAPSTSKQHPASRRLSGRESSQRIVN